MCILILAKTFYAMGTIGFFFFFLSWSQVNWLPPFLKINRVYCWQRKGENSMCSL